MSPKRTRSSRVSAQIAGIYRWTRVTEALDSELRVCEVSATLNTLLAGLVSGRISVMGELVAFDALCPHFAGGEMSVLREVPHLGRVCQSSMLTSFPLTRLSLLYPLTSCCNLSLVTCWCLFLVTSCYSPWSRTAVVLVNILLVCPHVSVSGDALLFSLVAYRCRPR